MYYLLQMVKFCHSNFEEFSDESGSVACCCAVKNASKNNKMRNANRHLRCIGI